MCSTGALISMQVAQGAGQFFAGRSQADAQEAFQEASSESLIRSTLEQEAAIKVNTQQEQDEIERAKFDATRESRRIRAASIVQQSESGQAGASAQRVLDDLINQGDRKQVRLDAKSTSVNAAEAANLKALSAAHFNQLNQINQPINKPSAIGALLSIGADVTQTLVFTKAAQKKAAGGVPLKVGTPSKTTKTSRGSGGRRRTSQPKSIEV